MATHQATISWQTEPADFASGRYSRGHIWRFDGGIEVPASSSPSVVPLPLSVEVAVDPEEAFVAALASCHMLWFLSLAKDAGLTIVAYEDRAEGRMGRTPEGRIAMLEVVLRPDIRFDGAAPSAADLDALHHAAHARCFIANSVKTEVRVEAAL